MGKPRARWNKLGRFISAIVVVAFFLPFFGVSCQGLDVVTVSGADMVGGCRPGGLAAAAQDEHKSSSADRSSADLKVENVKREPLAIIALALALAAAAFAWTRTRNALKVSFGLSLAGIAVLVALYVTVSKEIDDAVHEQATTSASKITKDLTKDIDSGTRFGLWIVLAGLAATAVMTGLALRDRSPDLPSPPPVA